MGVHIGSFEGGTIGAGSQPDSAGWHALRDEGRGWGYAALATPIAALWACHPTREKR